MCRFLLSAIILLLLNACNDSQPKKLEDAFILSIKKNDFKVLNDFLPDKKFYDAVSEKMPKRTEKEIENFLKESQERIKQAWQNTFYTVAEKKIDLDKVVIKEVFYHDPFPDDETNEAMVVNYEYKGSIWDDIQFIVSRKTGKTILLGIPNPTRAFSMRDKELRATNEAKSWIEMNKPEFKKSIEDISNKLIAAAKANDLNEFGQYLIYRGADESRLWRSAVNMNDSTERKMAAQFMERVNRNLQNCDKYKTGNFVTNRESEGLWITWPLDCDSRIVTLHYLRVNGQLLLGDTDVEEKRSSGD
jgi:hypothetical protein